LFNLILAELQLIALDDIWSDGIVMHSPAGTAMVRMDRVKKRIDLYVIGNEWQNIDLLQKIRQIILEVNHHFTYTESDEWVAVPNYPEITLAYEELMSLNDRKTSFITKFVQKKPVDINVQELIKNILPEIKNEVARVYISYSEKDVYYKNEFDAHLRPLIFEKSITLADDEIASGDGLTSASIEHLENAQIILILLSPDYLASEFTYTVEMPKMMELYETGRVKLVPILLRDTYWESLPINKLQMLPFGGQAVANSDNRDSIWRSITSELLRLAAEVTGTVKEVETLRISKVRLTNIRCFDAVEIDLFNEKGPQAFSLFLGENGVGKSTILKSIPLGIASESDTMAMLGKMSGEILKTGKEKGQIAISVYSLTENEEYTIFTNIAKGEQGQFSVSKIFPLGLDLKKLFLCGYGAARNRFGMDSAEFYSIASTCSTLFNYDAFLQNPELSFRRIQSKGISIDTLLRRVDQLLMLEPGSAVMDNSGLRLKGPWGEFVPMGGLGDGYKAMVGWIADLLGWSLMFDESMFQTHISGMVIIDELEQHLHPRWQLIIIKLLRDIFPKVQFIISSHTPLLASGASDYPDSGIYTIERNHEHMVTVSTIPREMIEGKTFNNVLCMFWRC